MRKSLQRRLQRLERHLKPEKLDDETCQCVKTVLRHVVIDANGEHLPDELATLEKDPGMNTRLEFGEAWVYQLPTTIAAAGGDQPREEQMGRRLHQT